MSVPEHPSSVSLSLRAAQLHRGNTLLLLALLASLLLWNVPYGQYALYPFKLLATWLHESSHGVLMILSGAGFDHMDIYPDTSGLSYPKAGVNALGQAFVSSAGYVGTSFFGALLLVLGRTPRGARRVLAAIGALLLLSAGLYVRNLFGIGAVVLFGGALNVIAWRASEPVAGFVLNFIAAQSCINAVLDIRVLYAATAVVNGQVTGSSDAHQMAAAVGGPPWLWATIWLAWSFLMFFLALRWMRLRAPGSD